MAEKTNLFGTERVETTVKKSWFHRLIAFVGPAYLVSVGYMDPGNWATDIEGGARFGYMLIWVLLLSNIMAVLLQTLAARFGIVTGLDLAQGCKRSYPPVISSCLWILAEIAVAATDLAEALGTIVGLNLLFGLPLLWGCVLTALDTFLFLLLEKKGVRKIEMFVVSLVAIIGGCFFIEVFIAKPDWGGIIRGFVPQMNTSALYVAIGMIGATVMPHNLYLHSALVQTRVISNHVVGKKEACGFNLIDSTVALNMAFLVNTGILITAAAAFYTKGIEVTEIQQAHNLLDGLLGNKLAPIVFAVALIAAGQSSTITGTLAGQVVMEGFIDFRIAPALRRFITRLLALVPAIFAIVLFGDNGIYKLLILSQVVLSLQLPFAIVPLIHFTSARQKMGAFANPRWLKVLAWIIAVVIIGLNGKLVYDTIGGWVHVVPVWGMAGIFIGVAGIIALLVIVTFPRFFSIMKPWTVAVSTESSIVASAIKPSHHRHIGVALEHSAGDSTILSAALAQAQLHKAKLTLIHVVDTPGTRVLGKESASLHGSEDEQYLQELAHELSAYDIEIKASILYGRPADEIVRAANNLGFDMLVVGSHGHRGIEDVIYGQTVSKVRHALSIPILVIRSGVPERAKRSI